MYKKYLIMVFMSMSKERKVSLVTEKNTEWPPAHSCWPLSSEFTLATPSVIFPVKYGRPEFTIRA